MLLLLDGWMDLNQTWTQCSPSGGASGLCSAFGSGSGSDDKKCVIKCDTRKTLLLLDGWMDLSQTWAQCSHSDGAFGCVQFLDPDQDPDSMSVSKLDIFYTF